MELRNSTDFVSDFASNQEQSTLLSTRWIHAHHMYSMCCTSHAHHMLITCSSHAHHVCSSHAHHMLIMCAHDIHITCTIHAHYVHITCTSRAWLPSWQLTLRTCHVTCMWPTILSGDGYLTAIDMRMKKVEQRSDQMESELLCVEVLKVNVACSTLLVWAGCYLLQRSSHDPGQWQCFKCKTLNLQS